MARMDMDKNLKKLGQPFQVFMIYPGKKKVKTRNICISEPSSSLGGGS